MIPHSKRLGKILNSELTWWFNLDKYAWCNSFWFLHYTITQNVVFISAEAALHDNISNLSDCVSIYFRLLMRRKIPSSSGNEHSWCPSISICHVSRTNHSAAINKACPRMISFRFFLIIGPRLINSDWVWIPIHFSRTYLGMLTSSFPLAKIFYHAGRLLARNRCTWHCIRLPQSRTFSS